MPAGITAIAIATSAISTEHFFTFSLSSLPSTKRFFADSEEGRKETRHAYIIATILSVGLAIVISYFMKNSLPLYVTLALSGVFIFLYERALSGKV